MASNDAFKVIKSFVNPKPVMQFARVHNENIWANAISLCGLTKRFNNRLKLGRQVIVARKLRLISKEKGKS